MITLKNRKKVQKEQLNKLNEEVGALLIMYDSDVEKTRQKTREYLKTIDIDRSENWWTTLRKLEDGTPVYPFESIEDDLFHFYFTEYYYNNKFELGIARIAVDELEFDLSMDFSKEFMMLKKVIDMIMSAEDEYLKYDENLNGLSYEELYNRYCNSIAIEYAVMEKRIWDTEYTKNENYSIIRVENFEHSKMFYKYTSPKSRWCMTYDKHKFDGYTQYGKYALYYVVCNDYDIIEKPHYIKTGVNTIESDDAIPAEFVDYNYVNGDKVAYLPYDEYGLSMMFVVVDGEGKLNCCASRWNHELGDYARDFLDEEHLSNVLGVNFYETFLPVSGKVKQHEKANTHPIDEVDEYEEKTELYMHGDCHIWALNNYKEGDKFFFITEYDYDIECTCLLHCGLYRNHLFIDATGEHKTIEDVLYDFDYGEYEEYIFDYKQFKKALKDLGISDVNKLSNTNIKDLFKKYSLFNIDILKETDDELITYYFNIPEYSSKYALYIYKDDNDSIYLSNLNVNILYRKLGIGTKIMNDIINILKEHTSFKKILLEVDKNKEWLICWYKSLGFNYLQQSYRDEYNWMIKTI